MRKSFLLILLLLTIVLTSCDSGFHPIRKSDFNGHTIGVLEGSLQSQIVIKSAPKARFVVYKSDKEVLDALGKGHCDAAFVDYQDVYSEAFKRNNLAIAFVDADRQPIGGAFNKEDTLLCEKFRKYLRTIKANGLYVNMENRWLATSRPDTVSPPKLKMPKGGVPLRIATEGELIPYSIYKQGQWTGFENELWTRFALWLGRSVEFVVVDFNDLFNTLKKRKADVAISTITITEERSMRVLFSPEYAYTSSVCLIRK